MIDLGTGNNNKINWAMEDKQELIDIIVSRPRALLCALIHLADIDRFAGE